MKLHKYLFIAAGMALAAGFTACDEGGLDAEYTPAAIPTGAQVYFDSADAGLAVSLEDGQTEVKVPVYRVNATSAMTLTLTLADESGLLSLADGGTVTFAAGEKEATATINVDFSSLAPSTKYPFTLTIPATDASMYADAAIEGYVEFAPWSEWTKLGTGTYLYAQYWSGDDPGLDIMWRQSLIDPKNVEFQILHVMYDVTMNFSGRETTLPNGYRYYVLNVPEQGTGYVNSNYNEEVLFCDMYNYTGNPKYEDYSLFDPQTGEFEFALVYYISLGVFANGYEYFQLDGYMTYEINLTDAGHYVDKAGVDYAIVQCHLGEGVAAAQYTAVSGVLTDNEIEQVVSAMLNGDIESKVTSESNGYLTFAFPEKGMYTVVVAGLDAAGNHVCTAATEIAYIPVGASDENNIDNDPEWTTLGYCSYTDDFIPALTNQVGPETFDVKIQENKAEAGYYRLVNAYGPDGWGLPLVDATQNYFIEIDAVDPDGVILYTNDQGVQPFQGYGDMYTSCMAIQYILGGQMTYAQAKSAGICGTLDSGFITFPVNQLMVGLEKPDGTIGGWTANLNGAFEVDLSSISTSAQRSFRTSVRRPVRTFGNPAEPVKMLRRSFLGNISTQDIINDRTKRPHKANF